MDQFVRANSTNLPSVDTLMIIEYLNDSDKHNIAEIRGAKALMSSRDAYIETAVGYVDINRNQTECTVRAKVVPEHKVSFKHYTISVRIVEGDDRKIIDTRCDGCAASSGGCKHTLVLLFWLQKRSSEPSPTSTQCYWKKPSLSGVRTEPISCENVFKKSKKIKLAPKNNEVRTKFLEACKLHNIKDSLLTSFSNPNKSLNIFNLTIEYVNENRQARDFPHYLNFLNNKITKEVIEDIENNTRNQVHSKLWHDIRQARITASKIYEASRCTTDGSLVQQLLGGYKVPETKAIKRGKELEKFVLIEVEKQIEQKINKCGFILINGIMGASPDGVGEDFVVEIKCPTSERTAKHYVSDNKINKKFEAQIQLQMYAARTHKGIFCVADEKFEENKKVALHWVTYNEEFITEIIENATSFWENFIYNKVISSAK